MLQFLENASRVNRASQCFTAEQKKVKERVKATTEKKKNCVTTIHNYFQNKK